MAAQPSLAIRSGAGVELWSSSTGIYKYEQNSNFARDETKNCRAMVFSPNGQLFAYTNTYGVRIVSTFDWKEKCILKRPRAFHLKFSPRGTYLITWELFKDKPEGEPNMFIYNAETGEELFSIIQKKQTDWEPCWSSDESLMALMIGGEAFFYDLISDKGFKSSATKMGGGKNGILSIGPGNSPPFISFYTPGVKGAPSMCKIYKYPALQSQQAIACKSFFKADRVDMLWNKRGTGLLLLTSTEVDQSGASYYGKQALHFMAIKGESCSVPLPKEGPVHAVQWCPKGNEFVVVYGYMPSKATLFNLKCDPIFDFGEGSRNCAYFNDFGNLLLLAGFGNLRGYVEIWDMHKKIKISTLQAPDSTLLEWCATGDIFMTATTAPRLRIGNCFKVWHYSGALLHETIWPQGQELLGVEWQKYAENSYNEPTIIEGIKIEGIKSSQPEASKQVYQPPNVRAIKEGKSGDSIPQPSATIPGQASGNKKLTNSNSQRRLSNRRDSNKNDSPNNSHIRRNSNMKPRNLSESNGRSQKDDDAEIQQPLENPDSNNCRNEVRNNPRSQNNRRNSRNDNRKFLSTGDPEKDKKIRNLHKKLSDIAKLKSKFHKGEHLEANQIKKIQGETSIIEELKTLKISSSS